MMALFSTPVKAFALLEDTISVGGDPSVFYIDGHITEETWNRFIVRLSHIKTVELNSPGGYVVPAEKIAKKIREKGLTTRVREGGWCFSACVLLFQSGVKRIAHNVSIFMLHPVSIKYQGVNVVDEWATNRYFGWLMRYGMKVSASLKLKKDKDVYFGANDALKYGIATKIIKNKNNLTSLAK